MRQYVLWVNGFFLNSSNVNISYRVPLITSISIEYVKYQKNTIGQADQTGTQATPGHETIAISIKIIA